jgi:hypothetical protein
MKYFSILFLSAALFFSCAGDKKDDKIDASLVNVSQNGDGTTTGNLPVITFTETEFDFGKMTQGERVLHDFTFTNTGKGQLIISNVTTTCGCTIAEKPKDPIAPGKTGKIKVEFNSDGKSGEVMRQITVVSNCEPNAATLKIKATVIVPESKYSNETTK